MSPAPARQCLGYDKSVTPWRRCPRLTRNGSGYCDDHTATHAQQARAALYDDPAWHKLRARLLARHRRVWGETCPGLPAMGRLPVPHVVEPPNMLTLDHIVPLALGGAPMDEANLQVLCKECNGRKDGSGRLRTRRLPSTWAAERRRP